MRKMIFTLAFAFTVVTGLPSLSSAKESNAELNYKTYCWQCHGMNGDGRGINTLDMSVQPRDHTDAKGMKGISDAQMFKAIKEGGLAVQKSVLMPPWGSTFSDDEIKDLIQYLRRLCNCKE